MQKCFHATPVRSMTVSTPPGLPSPGGHFKFSKTITLPHPAAFVSGSLRSICALGYSVYASLPPALDQNLSDLAACFRNGVVCVMDPFERFRTHIQAVGVLITLKVSKVRNMLCKIEQIIVAFRVMRSRISCSWTTGN